MEGQIQTILLHLPDHKFQLVMDLRQIILSANPAIREVFKWGRLTFATDKTDIAFVCSKQGFEYIELGFFKATALSDPKNMFEGKGKEIRRIRIQSLNKIPAVQIKKWVKEAMQLNK